MKPAGLRRHRHRRRHRRHGRRQPRGGTRPARHRARKERGGAVHLQLALHLRHLPHQLHQSARRRGRARPQGRRARPKAIARKDLARSVAKDGRRLMQWLRGEGIELSDLGQYHTHVLSPVQRSGAGLKWNGFAGDVALKRLEANLRSRQGRFLRGTRATALKPSERRYRGRNEGGAEIPRAQPWSSPTAASRPITTWCASTSRRAPDKLRAAPRRHRHRRRPAHGAGAGRRGDRGDGQLLRPSARPRSHGQSRAMAAAAGRRSGGGRHRHRRRRASASPTKATAASICRTPSPACPIRSAPRSIFDHAIWEGPPGRGHVQPPNPLVLEAGGTLHRRTRWPSWRRRSACRRSGCRTSSANTTGASTDGTLQKLTPPRKRPRQAVADQDRAVLRHADLPRRSPTPWAASSSTATPACSTASDKPIPGLYAAGSTVGGLDGGPHSGYVGGLIKATIGLRAAETIAGQVISLRHWVGIFAAFTSARLAAISSLEERAKLRDRHRHRLDADLDQPFLHRRHRQSLHDLVVQLLDNGARCLRRQIDAGVEGIDRVGREPASIIVGTSGSDEMRFAAT